MPGKYEETKHYINDPAGPAIVRFYPGMHGYFVTDPKLDKKNARTGGGTSLTGTLAKGQGLMLWPMWEAVKYLRQYFESTTIKDLVDDPDITIESILKASRDAHTKKSDRGKNVGTDAHAWIEEWCIAKMESQKTGKPMKEPKIPEVYELQKALREGYMRVVNTLKPKEIDEWKRLPKLIFKEIEIQEAIATEAEMVHQSILGAKAWLDLHEIYVHGAEDTVYSRKLFVCGKYDGDWTVTCTEKCNWCYMNKQEPPENAGKDLDFTGRYVVDFKSTNASNEQPKGIYPEYLAQCAVYETALLEEFPDRKYDGYLLLNGSKKSVVKKDKDKETGEWKEYEVPLFNTHFSFSNDQHRRWAELLAENKELIYAANKEMKVSNEGIKRTEKAEKK